MLPNYSIIPPLKKYPLSTSCSIISGTPLLYLPSSKTIVLGDIHLGQEASLFNSDSAIPSKSCIELTDLIMDVIDRFEIKRVICNGDIKHHTKRIKIQELEELKYFTEHITEKQVMLEFIQGNHDHLLEFIFPHIDMDYLTLHEAIILDEILIHHGHLDPPPGDYSTILLSHEHPSFVFNGYNKARVKLPAFVTLQAAGKFVIILPAASSISLGTSFPLSSTSQFLSHFLKTNGDLRSMEIFPTDGELGLLELPPVRQWRSKR